jgi:glucosamine-6-phosphate deaminase
MRMIIVDTPEQFDKTMALLLAAQLNEKPDSVLGMATGTTTTGIHRELVELYRQGVVSFNQAYTFNVDIRYPMALDHPLSGYSRMKEQLFDHVDMPDGHGCFPDSAHDDPHRAMADFTQKIASVGGLDLQVLPLGENGHIGFCQPGTKFGDVNVVLDLPEADYRLESYAEHFGGMENIPMIGLTLGPRDIMMARKLIFCAKGLHKAEIIAKALKGPVTEDVPASIVQLHPNVVVVLDKEAASKL